MNRDVLLSANGVSRGYGDVLALDAVDLEVTAGSVHGLLGPNGAGKSTLLRIVLGLIRRDAGTVSLLGQPVVGVGGGLPAGVAGSVDLPAFYPQLSARRNLRLLAAVDAGGAAAARVEAALAAVELTSRAGDRVGSLSFGMRQRLGLAAALLRQPTLLILDEPTSGLDPAGLRDLRRMLAAFAAEGRAVLLSSHDMADVELVCDAVTILNAGRVVVSEPLAELKARSSSARFRVATNDDRLALAMAGADMAVTASPEGLVVTAEDVALRGWLVRLAAGGVTPTELVRIGSGLEALFFDLVGAPA